MGFPKPLGMRLLNSLPSCNTHLERAPHSLPLCLFDGLFDAYASLSVGLREKKGKVLSNSQTTKDGSAEKL